MERGSSHFLLILAFEGWSEIIAKVDFQLIIANRKVNSVHASSEKLGLEKS
jgi:hypothetical protein